MKDWKVEEIEQYVFWFGLPFGSPNLTPRLVSDDDDMI